MSSKRKFCDHCKEFVTLRTFRLHADLYSIRASEAVYSSEEEEISHGDSEDFHVDHLAAGEAACALEVIDGQENETTSSGTKFFFTFWECLGVSVAKFPHSPILYYPCGSMCVVLCFATKKQQKQQKQRIVPQLLHCFSHYFPLTMTCTSLGWPNERNYESNNCYSNKVIVRLVPVVIYSNGMKAARIGD